MTHTNRTLLEDTHYRGHSEFYMTARHSVGEDGTHTIKFLGDDQTAIRNGDLRDQFYEHTSMYLPTRGEFQDPSKKHPSEGQYLVSVGTLIWACQRNKNVVIPVLERNGGVPQSGMYTTPSGLVSTNPLEAMWNETNEELGLIVNGKIAIVEPVDDDLHFVPNWQAHAERNKQRNAGRIGGALADVFAANSHTPDAFTILKANHLEHCPIQMDTVSFQGIIGTIDPIEAMVRVDDAMRTISVTRLVQIDLPEGADVKLVDPEFMTKEARRVQLATIDQIVNPARPKAIGLNDYAERTLANYKEVGIRPSMK